MRIYIIPVTVLVLATIGYLRWPFRPTEGGDNAYQDSERRARARRSHCSSSATRITALNPQRRGVVRR